MPTEDNGQQAGENQSSANAGQPAIDRTKWIEMDRYNGLQGKLQQTVEENKSLKAQLHDVTGSTEGKIASLTADLNIATAGKTTLESQLAALTQERDTFKTEATKSQSQLEVAKMLMTPDYQPLAPLYSEGLLAIDGKSGDELKAFLDKAVVTLGSKVTEQVQQKLSGVTPATPLGGSTPTEKELADQLMKLLPGTPEYAKVHTAWLSAATKQ